MTRGGGSEERPAGTRAPRAGPGTRGRPRDRGGRPKAGGGPKAQGRAAAQGVLVGAERGGAAAMAPKGKGGGKAGKGERGRGREACKAARVPVPALTGLARFHGAVRRR